MRYLGLFVLLAACAAPMQTLQITNRTSRPIDSVYVYPQGSADHGASRGALAPNASLSVQVKQGNVEVMAMSAKLKVDEHTRDQPSASQDLEIKEPAQVIFYDADQAPPPETRKKGVFGVAFTVPKAAPPPLTDKPEEPAP